MGISNVGSGLRPGICTSTTRPTTPYEGQMIYETDTDMVALWNGSAWRYIAATTPTNGTVLQVVSATNNTETAQGSAAWLDTSISASITPKSSSSKILVLANVNGCAKRGANTYIKLRLLRGATAVYQFETTMGFTGTTTDNDPGSSVGIYLDSPATTSSTTYKVQLLNATGAGNVYVNTGGGDTSSSMTLMEIAG